MKTSNTSGKSRKGLPYVFSLAIATVVGIIIGILLTHFHYHFKQHNLELENLALQPGIKLEKPNIRSQPIISEVSIPSVPVVAPIVPYSNTNTAGKGSNNPECIALLDEYGSGNRSSSSERLKSRGDIPMFLNRLGLLGIGVEVGVRDGEYSQWILSHWNGQKYHMVDPWLEQDKKVYNDVSNRNQEGHDQLYNSVKNTMETRFPGRHEIHRDYSVNVANKLLAQTNNEPMFDFIYLDARHDYAGIKEDMDAWWPLLKKGGLFAGHDFVEDGENSAGLFGVQKAVKEFVDYHGKEPMSISEKGFHGGRKEPKQHVDGGWTTWYFFK